jgi:hypothetical protein
MQIFTPVIPGFGVLFSFIYLFCICCTDSKKETLERGKYVKYGFSGFLRDTFKYKMWIYMLIIGIGLSISIQMYFGAKIFVVFFVCILIILAMFFNKSLNMIPEYAQKPVDMANMEKNACPEDAENLYKPIPIDPNVPKEDIAGKIFSMTPQGQALKMAGSVAGAKGSLVPGGLVPAAAVISPANVPDAIVPHANVSPSCVTSPANDPDPNTPVLKMGGSSFTPLKISGTTKAQKVTQSGGANYLEAYQNILRILQN